MAAKKKRPAQPTLPGLRVKTDRVTVRSYKRKPSVRGYTRRKARRRS